MKLGFDIDGVLADFVRSYNEAIKQETGILIPDTSDSYPDVWFYERAAGVTPAQEQKIWKRITASKSFWAELHPYPEVPEIMSKLNELRWDGHDIYFITTRRGEQAKYQTEKWLALLGMYAPSVILSSKKGLVAAGIGLDAMLDDRPENLIEVKNESPDTQVFILDRPYNRSWNDRIRYATMAGGEGMYGAIRVKSVWEMLDKLELGELKEAA